MKQEQFFQQILDSTMGDLEEFDPEGLQCSVGNILVITVPEKEVSDGGIHIPSIARQKSCVARVASVPDDLGCPVEPGWWVVFRQFAGTVVPFGTRDDLLILQYEQGPGSDLLGWFQEHPREGEKRG